MKKFDISLLVAVALIASIASVGVANAFILSPASPDEVTINIAMNGGSAVESDFTVNVTSDSTSATPSTPSFPGSAGPIVVLLGDGNYSVAEATSTASADYTVVYSSGCSGSVSALSPVGICTITNTYVDPPVVPLVDLSIDALVDNATPSEGDTITYTITATNLNASNIPSVGVTANDVLPSGVTFATSSATQGTYDSTSGIWTIGKIFVGSPAVLTIAATVNSSTAGTTIANMVTASESNLESDPDLSNNSSTASFTVAVPTPAPTSTPPSTPSSTPSDPSSSGGGSTVSVSAGGGGGGNGGGGGGGGGSANTSITPVPPTVTTSVSASSSQGVVLGASTSCGIYLTSYLKKGGHNDVAQVKNLQMFLNQNLGLNIPVTGFFGPLTFAAVKQFQGKYASDVLIPWNTSASGYVYKTTQWKINMLVCPSLELPAPQV